MDGLINTFYFLLFVVYKFSILLMISHSGKYSFANVQVHICSVDDLCSSGIRHVPCEKKRKERRRVSFAICSVRGREG